MGQDLVTCIQEVNPTPMSALALCIHMYFLCTMFYKKVYKFIYCVKA